MNLSSVDLKLLVVLDALIAERHVGRAGLRLGLSQPATSHALSRLRHMLRDPVLVRCGRTMTLTPKAEAIRPRLAEFIEAAQRVFEPTRFDPATSQRRFTLMLPDLVCHLMVPKLLSLLLERAPEMKLTILPWRGPELLSAWTMQSIDFIVTSMPRRFEGFSREPLYRDQDVLVVRSGWPAELAAHADVFRHSRHVAVVGAGETADEIDVWLSTLNIERNVAVVAPNYMAALEICATTDLVAFLPAKFAASFLSSREIEILASPVEPPHDVLDLLTRRQTLEDPATLWVKSLVVAIAAGL